MNKLEKLQYYKESTGNKRYTVYPTCRYCSKNLVDLKEFFIVHSRNQKILSFFEIDWTGCPATIYLCEECFSKLRDTLEDCENEGWQVLDPDSEEFKDLDEEIERNQETGSGK